MARAARSDRLGAPRWNLSPLCGGADLEHAEKLLTRAKRAAKRFRTRYEGRVSALSAPKLARAIASYEKIEETVAEVEALLDLLHTAGQANDASTRLLGIADGAGGKIASDLAFFVHELLAMEDDRFAARLRRRALARRRTWLERARAKRQHRLALDTERVLSELDSSWARLYNETIDQLRYTVRGRHLTLEEASKLLDDPDPRRRRAAAQAMVKVQSKNSALFALAFNAIARDEEVRRRWRGFTRPVSVSTLEADVPDAELDALLAAVAATEAQIPHRWYALKARILNGHARSRRAARRRAPRIDWRDRFAPLPGTPRRRIPWTEASDIVLSGWRSVSPELAAVAKRIFAERRIDAAPRAGKAPGAFSRSTVPAAGPFVMMTYRGTPEDVIVLAHEIGHAIHQTVATANGFFGQDANVPLSETASIFSERLAFREMLRRERTARGRRALLAERIEVQLNNSYRQASLHRFEDRVHFERADGEVSVERLSEIWLEEAKRFFGPAVLVDDDYGVYWSQIPHFFDTPFYVWSYAYAECVSAALWQAFESGMPDFEEHFRHLLEAGNTVPHQDLLAPFGADPSDQAFWRRGLLTIAPLIDEVEELS